MHDPLLAHSTVIDEARLRAAQRRRRHDPPMRASTARGDRRGHASTGRLSRTVHRLGLALARVVGLLRG